MRASYPRAIAWLALNDDCHWAYQDDAFLSVSACMVVDLWGKAASTICADVRKYREQEGLPDAR